ncbi:4-cresol dehydrogenase (hydroxylating) [Desulfacinum hydrothermale DSM 13146]|uniref:4-cresol dehydrogenase (Hydroxylating) n=1 Tax=Desulfacinum hydrothermale DSM 13146 TaxID=1121390 RepID=A0A1W1XAW2_9BACT|nr:FAD-binding oxidoreductase [Desulfacinum hydrothermale]SMC21000.1 4-cresol dehydrogenase (hydroxylating) [Desulfacinum hydrothermale DSM 13146]
MKEEAIRKFRDALGPEDFLDSSQALERYLRSTIPVHRRIAAVARPRSVDQVRAVVAIAAQHKIPLYPISTGKNWGYGSANPVRDDNLIVDLSQMNRIIEVNSTLAYAVIEPGVTQAKLYRYLEEHGTGLMMDPTGSGPQCSVLGNALERGYGITPYGDHFASICGLEVVLANGEVLRTGFTHYPQARSSYVYKYGIGPYLDGIFTQSNYGIVTKMGLWLMPKPQHTEVFYFFAQNESDLPGLINAVRSLLLSGTVRSAINLVHRDRALTMTDQYPWTAMRYAQPLHEGVARRLAKKRNIFTWNGVGAVYGTRQQVKASKKVIKALLKGKVDRIQFVSDQHIRFLDVILDLFGQRLPFGLSKKISLLKQSFGILKGKPAEVSLKTPYWRAHQSPPQCDLDPARDNCGLIWLAPVIPMQAEDVKLFVNLVRRIVAHYRFETCLTFTAVNPRALDCSLPILYDKSDPEEISRAEACYEHLLKECMASGYIPYRTGIQSMKNLVSPEDHYWRVVHALKKALDPDGIIAPGRYNV